MFAQRLHAGQRFGTMILDHIIMTMIAMVFAIPGMIVSFSRAFDVSHGPTPIDPFGGMAPVMLFGFALYLCKDSIQGRSPAKRVIKLQVVNNAAGLPASPLRCLVRNLFLVLWPIELIVALINPPRRIGDFVAGTKVVLYQPTAERPKQNWLLTFIALAIAYGIMLPSLIPINKLQQLNTLAPFVESSFNKTESDALKQTFIDSLGNHVTPDVRVYDKIQDRDGKYVSIIFELKENYLASEEDSYYLKERIRTILNRQYPQGTIAGQLQYVYRGDGGFQSHVEYLHLDGESESDNAFD
jgi:uncharacterized RDD family membrane protein YckC